MMKGETIGQVEPARAEAVAPEAVIRRMTPRPEVLSVFSNLFRKRWNEAE